MTTNGQLYAGIAAGILTGALWGLVFLAPQTMTSFTPMEIAFGRFFFFGVISLTALRPCIRIMQSLDWREKFHVVALSAAGFWLYSLILFWSILNSGGVVTTLVIGLIPITIPLAAKKTVRLGWHFTLGLLLLFAGLLTLNLPGSGGMFNTLTLTGVIVLTACVASWTWYAIKISAFVKRHPSVNKRDISSLMGIISMLALGLISIFTIDLQTLAAHPEFNHYLVWCAVIGIGSTWVANWLWNICSGACPSSVSGPLVISETVFGLLFTFMYQSRLPTLHEAAAIALFAAGVFLTIRAEMGKT